MDYNYKAEEMMNAILLSMVRIQGYQLAFTQMILEQMGKTDEEIKKIVEDLSQGAAEYGEQVAEDLYAKFGRTPNI